tara:strand:- start:127 stop:393 length:267 start_codon:yes stop_codon:yes gene_type:complete
MTELITTINTITTLSTHLSILKKKADQKYHSIQTKNGMAGWILFHRVKSMNYSKQINGHLITSYIAKEWKNLSNKEQLFWKDLATLSF